MKNIKKQNKSTHTNQNRKSLAVPTVATEEVPVTIEEKMPASFKNAPLYKTRMGRVTLTIWSREDKNGTVRFSINLSRSYKTEEGYRDTTSLDQGDLASAIALLNEAQSVLPPLLPRVDA